MNTYEEAIAKCYSTWGNTYYSDYYGDTAAYPPVQLHLLRKLLAQSSGMSLLDAGCGPASFLRNVADLGLDLYGFDLTPEMVAEAKRIVVDLRLSPSRIWAGSILEPKAFHAPDNRRLFDSIICGGVMPHISQDDDTTVAENIFAALSPGGFCAVEARNQLFALFTLNRYSYELMMNQLIRPALLQNSFGVDPKQIETLQIEISRQFQMDLPPIRKGKNAEPGYDEVLSRTHNPFELQQVFSDAGFINLKVLFYHFHAFPPMFQSLMPEIFLKQSLAMEKDPENWRGNFMASAFYIVGNKP